MNARLISAPQRLPDFPAFLRDRDKFVRLAKHAPDSDDPDAVIPAQIRLLGTHRRYDVFIRPIELPGPTFTVDVWVESEITKLRFEQHRLDGGKLTIFCNGSEANAVLGRFVNINDI